MINKTDSQKRFIQQCAQQQRQASGKRYKNESSMKDILNWNVGDTTTTKDFKKKTLNISHEHEFNRFQSKIKKSPSKSMTTEFQDNFRGYVYVPEEKVYVPALAQQQLEYLEQPDYIPVPPPQQIKEPQKVYEQAEVEYEKIKKGTQYKSFYGKLKTQNKKELYDILYDNFVEIYPKKISYNTKIPRRDLYHEENYDEYQQETSQFNEQDQERLENLQYQQKEVEQQIDDNFQQLQLQEQLQKEQNLVHLQSELQNLLIQQKNLSQEIEQLERAQGQGFKSYQPKAVIPADENRLKQREKRIQKFAENSRQLPNSAFTTYYGKPAFENYGNANIKDKNQAFISGNYLKSHNINPHRGETQPEYEQTFQNAINLGKEEAIPHPPRHRLEEIPTKKQLDYNRKNNPFYPQQNELLNQSIKNQVFCSSNIKKVHPLLRQKEDANQIVIHNHAQNTQQNTQYSQQQLQNQQKNLQNSSQNIQNQQQNLKQQSMQQKKQQKQVQNNQILIQEEEDDEEVQNQDRSPLLPEPHPSVESENLSQQNLIFENSQYKQSANNFTDSQLLQKRQQGQMEQFQKKKEKQNLIVTKVTDTPQIDQITYQTRVDYPIDAMNPPQGYLFSMHECELNPQYYKTINKQWLNRIPYAGKKALVQEDLFEILQHQPLGQDPVY
ncbi:hypothetical protein TTHERM_00794090 (macronuclear) [Tetrahymena thermophila SB210]|uniref:Uncharacterized protein n=1 Tax=Tetrahymena thermophila (strain SB210) TaxID=312017 RepID=Q23W22_TETTS|nr:hypothetical protein TTHERM_00794090 [Tetrahymena thermophila SB210]EAS00683.2 hypothetical protein TTHERM_00794090 [Tetrahymena thermophila SB210]|eukprot:XP_001020928.2 hypothetical protein TTHERM_00794090 [Tetrahymena thermophila SB210]